MAKTLRFRIKAGWNTKAAPDVAANRLISEEIDDNFLALEAAQEAHVAANDPHPQYATVFDDVAALKADTEVTVGKVVRTLGYTTAGDGGGNVYEIVAAATGTDDGGSFIDLAGSGLQAKGLFGESVNVRQFGAVGDGVADDTAAIQAALDVIGAAGGGIVYLPAGTYSVINLTISPKTRLSGENRGATTVVARTGRTLTVPVLQNKNVDAGPARLDADIQVEGIAFDGNGIVYPLWLTNPDTGVAIADPQNDYFANGGKINDPTYAADPDSIALTQTPGGAGNITLNGVLVTTGTASMAPAVRKVSITSAGNDSARTFTVTGTDYDDVALVEVLTGANAGAATTSGVFKTVTQIAVDAATASSITAGTAAFDIFGVVAEKRRNPNYMTGTGLIRWNKCIRPVVRNCTFRNHNGTAIVETGSLDPVIEYNHFEAVGKLDGPFPAIFTQGYGNIGDDFYSPSRNVVIQHNTAKNIERSFCLFSPVEGGRVEGNYVDGWKESCIFINSLAIGGHLVIKGNRFENGVISDIVCTAIETNNDVNDIDIIDNHFEEVDGAIVAIPGARHVEVSRNTLVKAYNGATATLPYGPFSERYGFNAGVAPIAGNARSASDQGYFKVGTMSGLGNDFVRIGENRVIETRASGYPPVVKQYKQGGENASKNVIIENNLIDIHADMPFLDTSVGNVWALDMPFWIRNNTGHVSESPVFADMSVSTGVLGLQTVTVGFRPSKIEVVANHSNPALARNYLGSVVWKRNPSPAAVQGRGFYQADNGTTRGAWLIDNEFIRITDESNGMIVNVEFASWTETGFVVNVIAATANITVRLVCHP